MILDCLQFPIWCTLEKKKKEEERGKREEKERHSDFFFPLAGFGSSTLTPPRELSDIYAI